MRFRSPGGQPFPTVEAIRRRRRSLLKLESGQSQQQEDDAPSAAAAVPGEYSDPRRLSDGQIWQWFVDIARGLQHLHHLGGYRENALVMMLCFIGVLHRDIKPTNILLTSDPDRMARMDGSHYVLGSGQKGLRAMVSDFGTAELAAGGTSESHTGFTGKGTSSHCDEL